MTMGVTFSLRVLMLCALALGVPSFRHSGFRGNKTLMMHQKQLTHKKILLNVNAPPLVNLATELQTTFNDVACRNCTECMERAIKAHRVHSYVLSTLPNTHELFYEVINTNRYKRGTEDGSENKVEVGKNVSVTVTKYTKDMKTAEIEVKEINENGTINTCNVYSVKKSMPCNTGSEFVSKRKNNKRSKKSKVKLTVATTEAMTEKNKSSSYKKREVDNSEMFDNFMTSVEEMY